MNANQMPAATVKSILEAVVNSVNDTAMFGRLWPEGAVFCATYVHHTWPTGWDNEVRVRFFNTAGEFELFMSNMQTFAQLEDNDYAMRAYEWDWGPTVLPLHTRNAIAIVRATNVSFVDDSI